MLLPYRIVRPLLFALPAETSHDLVMGALGRASNSPTVLSWMQRSYGERVPELPTDLLGLAFSNPVGLAAGLDKQGNCGNAFSAMGFGWVEMGTVTPKPQPGNEKPRMFRLKSHQAIINRMGFNSCGLTQFLRSATATDPGVIQGINIGKNAKTPIENAAEDYTTCLEMVYPHASYITVNISSPNTQNLRALQSDEALDTLLATIVEKKKELTRTHGKEVPLVLKIAPDLDDAQIQVIAVLLQKHGIDAVAATNTTIDKSSVSRHIRGNETGGLSGVPLRQRSTEVIRKLAVALNGQIPIIGIGGIDDPLSAIEKLKAGASLLQLYTGFIYQGPTLVAEIVEALRQECGDLSFNDWLANQHRILLN
ncbi:MAG: quinone-dependent dihydroorotate dehydrogenase [Acidiferrobacterales bacterium]|nr:quinone-dependent dihydroorotate dehydrogenase [Acidiferrobacterales bacterium]